MIRLLREAGLRQDGVDRLHCGIGIDGTALDMGSVDLVRVLLGRAALLEFGGARERGVTESDGFQAREDVLDQGLDLCPW